MLVLLGAALPGAAQAPADATTVARVKPLPVPTRQEEAVRQALREVPRRHDETIDTWTRICRVSALPGEEAQRAALMSDLLRSASLTVRIRPDGNVEGRWPGSQPGIPAVISAHLDALHAPSPDNPVKVDGATMTGPGVLDDGSGLVALARAARFLAEAGWKPRREVRFLATVGEEVGLVGARSYVKDNPQLAAFVSIDGILGAVEHGATGIRWLRFTYTGRGGHTLLSARTPSPSMAAGRAIAAIADLSDETDAAMNVSMLSGGDAPNAIPTRTSFTLDLRSDDPDELARITSDVTRLTRATADREGVTLATETLQDLPWAPALDPKSPLVAGAAAILSHVGVEPRVAPRGSSDHDIALLAGIPAIAVGATLGRHAHSPVEAADVKALDTGIQQVVLLVVLLGEGLPEAPEPSAQ
jgi:acetylornithine deacetylase/succinyl-diaminopimelate desuccinylase-like protein